MRGLQLLLYNLFSSLLSADYVAYAWRFQQFWKNSRRTQLEFLRIDKNTSIFLRRFRDAKRQHPHQDEGMLLPNSVDLEGFCIEKVSFATERPAPLWLPLSIYYATKSRLEKMRISPALMQVKAPLSALSLPATS